MITEISAKQKMLDYFRRELAVHQHSSDELAFIIGLIEKDIDHDNEQ